MLSFVGQVSGSPAGAQVECALARMFSGRGNHPAPASPHRGWSGRIASESLRAGSHGPGQLRLSLSTSVAWAGWGLPESARGHLSLFRI